MGPSPKTTYLRRPFSDEWSNCNQKQITVYTTKLTGFGWYLVHFVEFLMQLANEFVVDCGISITKILRTIDRNILTDLGILRSLYPESCRLMQTSNCML